MSTTNIRIRYEVLDKELKEARAEIVKLSKNTDSLIADNKKLGSQYEKLSSQVRKTSTGFGGLAKNLSSLAGALGVTSGILLLGQTLRNAARSVVDFQKQNAVLAGVLNKSREEIKKLTDDANRLGSITAKTASEVTQLQIALARLGFSEREIINLTEPLINGSIALNAELDQTAELVGAVVRTFDDFDSLDAPEIIDKLTVSTQRSALNFDKLQTALPIVAGAANAAGVDFSRLLALLGKLADAGIDTSTSATSLRNIFIDAASKGLSYSDILEQISSSSNQLTASTDEFGRRTAVSASVISNQLDTLVDLEEALNNAGGTAQRVAETQLATLSGQIDLLTSAWQGFIFSVDQGDGVLGTAAKTTIKLFTDLLTGLSTGFEEPLEKILKLQQEQQRQQSISNQAQVFYNEALDNGLKTFEDFQSIYAPAIDQNINKTEILEQVQSLYNEALKETTKTVEVELGLLEKLKKELKDEVELREKALTPAEIKRRTERIELIKEEIKELTNLEEAYEETFKKLKPKSSDFKTQYQKDFEAVKESARKFLGDEVAEDAAMGLKKVGNSIKEFRENQKEKDKEDLEAQSERQEVKDQLIAMGFEQAANFANRLTELRINNYQREFESLELQKQYELSLAGDNAEGIAAIEAKFAKKSSEIKQKQAKADKAGALFDIAINTAAAIVNQLKVTPLPAGLPLAIAIGATGAIQAGIVASQKIPKFAEGGEIKGKSHARGGVLLEAEGGEFIMKKDAVNRIGLQNLDLMNRKGEIPNTVVNVDTKELVNELKRRPEVSLNWNEKGFTSYLRNKNTIVARKSKKYAV